MVSVFLVFDIFQNIFDSLYCYGVWQDNTGIIFTLWVCLSLRVWS